MSNKLISILMPVKDAGKYLQSCLQSVIAQSYPYWELIAIDDHSSDNSIDILKDFENQDHRLKVGSSPSSGIVAALKAAYALSNGDLIHRMDADDIMPENKLNLLLDAHKDGELATGMVEYFSDDWLVGLGFQNYQNWINSLMQSGKLWEDIYMECPIPSPAWLIDRTTFDAVGAFNSDLIPEDYDLCFRLYKHQVKINTVKEVVHCWRDSQNRTSRKLKEYFPMAYYPLKVHYFLKIDRNPSKKLVLWGAGKKGKLISRLLNAQRESYLWVTDNKQKIGLHINEVLVHATDEIPREHVQIILAVASPEDKIEIQQVLDTKGWIKAIDYWWFC